MLSCKIAECTGRITQRACPNSSGILTQVHPEPDPLVWHCSETTVKLDTANRPKKHSTFSTKKKGLSEDVRVTWRPSLPIMPMPTSAAWIIATSLAPSPMPSILPLKRRCCRFSHLWMPLDPPSAFFICTMYTAMSAPLIKLFMHSFTEFMSFPRVRSVQSSVAPCVHHGRRVCLLLNVLKLDFC